MGKIDGVTFCVITDPNDRDPEGSLACEMMFMPKDGLKADSQVDRGVLCGCFNLDDPDKYTFIGFAKSPVFKKGELLLLNKSGREIIGSGRKPSKWFIGYELYDDMEAALTRAVQVSSCEVGGAPQTPDSCIQVETCASRKKDCDDRLAILKSMSKEELEKIPGVKEVFGVLSGEGGGGSVIETGLNAELDRRMKEKKKAESGAP